MLERLPQGLVSRLGSYNLKAHVGNHPLQGQDVLREIVNNENRYFVMWHEQSLIVRI
jgi:hypothetical protein